MSKIRILHTKTIRELTHQYERVGVYHVNGLSVVRVVYTMLGVYGALPNQYPSLKAGNWEFDFEKYIEFQAVAYTDITGWKMLLMVEEEDREGATVTLAFSGHAKVPLLLADRFTTIFQKGDDLLQVREEYMQRFAKPPPPPSRWQRFKNWFRFSKKPKDSSPSILDDIGDVLSDLVD